MAANTFHRQGLSLVRFANGPCLPYGTVPGLLPSMAPSEMLRMPVPVPNGNTWEDDWMRIGVRHHSQRPFVFFHPHHHIPIRKQHQDYHDYHDYHRHLPSPCWTEHADSRCENSPPTRFCPHWASTPSPLRRQCFSFFLSSLVLSTPHVNWPAPHRCQGAPLT